MTIRESLDTLQNILYNTGHIALFVAVIALGFVISAIPLTVLYLTRQRGKKKHTPED